MSRYRSLAWFSLVLGVLMCGCLSQSTPTAGATPTPVRSPQTTPTTPKHTWTVMLYLDGDNDLEDSQSQDIGKLVALKSNPEVEILILIDRSAEDDEEEGYSAEKLPGLGNWTGAKLVRVKPGGLDLLEDWKSVNMADGKTLERFLVECQKRAPAQHYVLSLMDHGEAWLGVCRDEEHPDDIITLTELSDALRNSGLPRLDLLMFDACAMANLEVANAVAPHAKLMLASEELVAWSGLLNLEPLQQLMDHPEVSPRQLADSLAKAFLTHFRESEDEDDQSEAQTATISILDLDRIAPIQTAVDKLAVELAKRLAGGAANWRKLARARSESQEYGHAEEPLDPNFNVFDLVDLCEHLQKAFPDLAPLCQEVIKACGQAVLYSDHGPDRERSHGLSVFFAADLEEYSVADPLTYAQAVAEGPWSQMLARYVELERTAANRPKLATVESDGDETDGDTVVSLRTRVGDPDDIQSSHLILLRQGKLIGVLPSPMEDNSTYLEDVFDGNWLLLDSGRGAGQPCQVADIEEDDHEDEYMADVPVFVRHGSGGKAFKALLHFKVDLSDDELSGRFSSAFRVSGKLTRQFKLKSDDQIRPSWEGATSRFQTLKGKPRLVWGKLPPGNYEVGFEIVDYGGDSLRKTVPVKVVR